MSGSEVNFTYSCVISKQGKPYISVLFERGNDSAEGSIPECKLSKNQGFSDEEVEQLESYLREHKQEIIENSKSISGFSHWF